MAKKEKATNITKEQLEKIQSIVSNINQFNLEIGRIETRKHAILHQATITQEALNAMQDELKEEYGTVNVNIETGEIKYQDDVEANKED
jgi:spore germination protein YaaH